MNLLYFALFVALASAAPTPQEEGPVEVIVNGVPNGHALEVANIVDITVKEKVDGEIQSASNPLHPYSAVGIAEAAAALIAEAEANVANTEVRPEPAVLPEPNVPEVIPEAVVLPAPLLPEVIPEPAILPAPLLPEVVPEPAILPAPVNPVVVPEPAILPGPVEPVVVPEPAVLPAPVEPVVVPEPAVLPAPVEPVVVPEPAILPAPVEPAVVPEPAVLPAPVEPVIIPEPAILPEPVVPEPSVLPEQSVNGDAQASEAITGEIYNDGVVQVSLNVQQETGVLQTLSSWVSMVLSYFNNGVQYTQQLV